MRHLSTLEKEWIKMLDSGKESIVLNALYEIRNSGTVRMLPYIINLLTTKQKESVRNYILQFIGDIKSQDAVPYIVESLNSLERNPVFPDILSACWQSGLDFSKYIPMFAGIFIRSDFQTSLEAFTIIEEALPYADNELKTQCLVQLKSAQQSITERKNRLLSELIKTIQDS